jgi:hypothetical protein
MSKNKLIITEEQLALIAKVIKEDAVASSIKNQVSDYLKKYYTPSFGTYKDKGVYNNEPMFQNKVDDELITPKNLLLHLIDKFNFDEKFLSTMIRHFYDNNLDNKIVMSQVTL